MTGTYLGVTVLNTSTLGDDKPKLFITENAALNALKFKITTTSEEPITLTQQQVFTVTPPRSLWNEDVGVAGKKWHIQPNSGRFENWTVQPVKPMTVVKGQPVSFQFENLKISDKADLGMGLMWHVSWEGFDNVSECSSETKIFVYLPVKQDLNMKVLLDPGTQVQPLDGAGHTIGDYLPVSSVPYFPQNSGEVFSTPPNTNGIYTQHKFYLQNVGKDIKFSADSQFTLNFTFADDSEIDINALCQKRYFADVVVEQWFENPYVKWSVQQQLNELTWLLQPGEGTVLAHKDSVAFLISNIYTTLPAYITSVFVSYAGIPNTSPGLFSFDLFKTVTPPAVPVLTVDGKSVPREEAPEPLVDNPLDVGLEQKVTLGWATVGINEVQLDPRAGKNISVKLAGKQAWRPYPTAAADGGISLSTSPMVQGGNQWVFNLKPPQIDALMADGQNPGHQYFGPVKFTWNTRFASAVTLLNQQGHKLVQYEQLSNPAEVDHGSYSLPLLNQNETFTLVADGYEGPVEKTVQVLMNPPQVPSFHANYHNPLKLEVAGPVTLTWITVNTTAITLFDGSHKVLAHFDREANPDNIEQGLYKVPFVAFNQSFSILAEGFTKPVAHQQVKVIANPPMSFTYNPKPAPGAEGGSFEIEYDFSRIAYGGIRIMLVYFLGATNMGFQLKKIGPSPKKDQLSLPFSSRSWYGGQLKNLKKGTPLTVKYAAVFYHNFQSQGFFSKGWSRDINFLE